MTDTTKGSDNDTEVSISASVRDGIDAARSQLSDATEDARHKATKAVSAAKESLGQAKETLGGVLATGRDKVTDLYAVGRDTAGDALGTGRDRAGEAFASVRTRAKAAGDAASDQLAANPLVALIGGIAAGVVLGALLPRTERETQALGGVGQKLNDLAKEVLAAAREAGEAKLEELGLTPDKGRESLHALIDGALAAATSAGTAAVATTRGKAPTEEQASA